MTGARDPRIDAYIKRAAPFARPILTHLREVVHAACPEVEETIKWGMPMFTHHGILCFMAAFKQHAGFGFWKGSKVVDDREEQAGTAMGQFGRLTEVEQLPSRRSLEAYVRKAMRLNEAGDTGTPKPRKQPKAAPRTPAALSAALARNAKARTTWQGFSPGHRRAYVEWIAEAKRLETRARRIATSIEWLAAGKPHNWKYR
jgi:uncharacterized protein YdeI (YjbR/CyaY-like superfamily)